MSRRTAAPVVALAAALVLAAGAGPATAAGQAGPHGSGLTVGLQADPDGAYSVNLEVNLGGDRVPVNYTVNWGDGTSESNGDWGGRTLVLQHTYPQLGHYPIGVSVSDGSGGSASGSVDYRTTGTSYTPSGPTRLLDTRSGTGAPKVKVAPGGTARVKVGGAGGIPQGVRAAVLNLTVTDASGPGYITAYDEGGQKPATSNLNFKAGQTVPNLAVVPVGADGYVDLYNGSSGSVDLIADLTGYFGSDQVDGYTPVQPTRLVDTRSGVGVPAGRIPGRGTIGARVYDGILQLPDFTDISAVALNVTVTRPGGAGFLTAYPSGQQLPTASNLNFSGGQTIANSVVVPVGPDGVVKLFNGSGQPTDVVVDVVGVYGSNSRGAYVPTYPARVLDSRHATDFPGPLEGGSYVHESLSAGNPQVTAYVMNATVTDTQGPGYLTVAPDPNTAADYLNGVARVPVRPLVSSLNWQAGDTVPNLVQASTGRNGVIDFWTVSGATSDLVLDVFGFYSTR